MFLMIGYDWIISEVQRDIVTVKLAAPRPKTMNCPPIHNLRKSLLGF